MLDLDQRTHGGAQRDQREHDRYIQSRNLVPLRDTPVTEGERNALERAKERSARYKEKRPDKINPVPQSEAL